MNIDINIGSFETFADYFFDGLISDWIVQSGINESLDSVHLVANDVDNVIGSLKEKLKSIQKYIALGHLIIPTSAVRDGGILSLYRTFKRD